MTVSNTLQWQVAPQSAPIDDGKQMEGSIRALTELTLRNAQFDAFKRDYEVKASEFRLCEDGAFTIHGADGPDGETLFTIEDPALRQMCARYGPPFMNGAIPFNYARALIDTLPATYGPILATHAAGYGKNIFLRTYDATVRAYMSDRFTHIDNAEVLGMLSNYLGDKGGDYVLVRPYVGRDSMNIRIMVKQVLPKDGDSAYGMGCVVRTGEIGNVSPQVLPFIQRTSCTNSTIWQEGGITLKQTGNRESKLMLLAAAMGEALSASVELVKRMLAARYEKLPNLADIVSRMADEHDWAEAIPLHIMAGSEQAETVAGLVNGITYAAHKSGLGADDALLLEMFGGKLLMQRELVEKYRK